MWNLHFTLKQNVDTLQTYLIYTLTFCTCTHCICTSTTKLNINITIMMDILHLPICSILVTRMISLATLIIHDNEKLLKKYVKFEVLMAVIMRNSLLGCDTVWLGRNLPMLWETANFYHTTWHHVRKQYLSIESTSSCNDRWKAAL